MNIIETRSNSFDSLRGHFDSLSRGDKGVSKELPLKLPSVITKSFKRDKNPSFSKSMVDSSRYSYLLGCPKATYLDKTKKQLIRIVPGIAVGSAVASLVTSTGLETAMHEVVGHGLLGLHLTHNYSEGNGPTYQVDGWDNLQAIWKADNFPDGLKEFGRFLIGHDRNGDGGGGVTQYRYHPPNELGQAMGSKGLSAWISISGSVPGLILNSLMVAGGMKLKEHEPTTGYMMVTFGLMQHLVSSGYSWSAAVMSEHELIGKASHGHDFANFAIKIGDITGVSPQAVAISTAVLWTAFVPAIAVAMYCYQKAHETDIVPDHLALQQWLSKAVNDQKVQQTIEKYIESYPRKKNLLSLWTEYAQCIQKDGEGKLTKALRLEMQRFAEYLINKLPKKTLNRSKKEVLRKWEKMQTPDNIQKALSILSIIGTISALGTKIITVLAQTSVQSLTTVASVLSYATPIFLGVSVASNAYETYKDLKSSDKAVPKAAKMISVAKLVVAVATAVGICVGLFVPGLNAVLIVSLLTGLVAGIALAYARQRIIKHRFNLLQSLEPQNWVFMYDLLQIYKEDHATINVSKDHKKLHRWITLQKEAKKYGLLAEEQLLKLKKIGIFP